MKVFLVGAKGSGVGALARALHAPPVSRFLTNRGILTALDRLWQATEVRVRRPGTPWAHPEPPEWVDAAVADFGRLLIRQHGQGASVVGIAEPEAPTARIQRWFPRATVLHVVRDGLCAPIAVPSDPIAAAQAGLAWAERWAASVEAAAGLPVLQLEALTPEAVAELADALSIPTVGPLDPRPRARLEGPAAEGFACSAAAVRHMAALGYACPQPGALSQTVPALLAARARGLLAADAPEAALAMTESPHPVVLTVRGEILRALGDEDGAAAAWQAAIVHADAPAEAWLGLLSLSDRPESLPAARRARCAADPTLRAAAARWMVARGMDHEAAEAIARVHGQRWYIAP